MIVLLDTCIVVDFLQQREPFFDDANAIFEAAATDKFSAFITAKSVTDIYYLMHHVLHDNEKTKDILRSLLEIIDTADSMADDVIKALDSKVSDFEDAVMCETAIRLKMDCIVTRNDRDYKNARIPILTPSKFLDVIGGCFPNPLDNLI